MTNLNANDCKKETIQSLIKETEDGIMYKVNTGYGQYNYELFNCKESQEYLKSLKSNGFTVTKEWCVGKTYLTGTISWL